MIKDVIPQNLLSEDSLNAIEEAFNNRVQLHVEKALEKQDEEYANKLKSLLEAIDQDRTSKLKKVVEALDRNNSMKLLTVVKKYEKELNESAGEFKQQLVSNISTYLEAYLDEVTPITAIEEATRNKQAVAVLEGLRKTLAVDSALMKESIKDAVVEGKQMIEEATTKAAQLEAENTKLKNKVSEMEKNILIESKVAKMQPSKQEYIKKILTDKDLKFVQENFDYVSKLYDKKEAEQTEVIKEQAFSSRTVKADAPKVVPEKKETKGPLVSGYLDQLKKFR